MKALSRARIGVTLRLLWVLCPIFACYAVAAPLPDSHWEEGLNALNAGDATRAADQFSAFVQSPDGALSPDAHHNLGLALWKLNRHGGAVYEWLRAATLSVTPWYAMEKLTLLTDAQKELGIRDGATEHPFFQLYLFANHDFATLLYCIAGWFVGGMLLFHWKFGKRTIPKALYALPVMLVLVAAGANYAHDRFFHYGVLEAATGEIALYRAPGDPVDKKLADLPDGTIVMVGKTENGFTQVEYPVAGWVSEKLLRTL